MKVKILGSWILLSLLTFPIPTTAQNEIPINFELNFSIDANNRIVSDTANFIKAAIQPLGIKLNLLNKDFWGQINDLTRDANHEDWGLTQMRFGGGGNTPELGWLYSTDEFWACILWPRLCGDEFNTWQFESTGINQSIINEMLTDIDLAKDIEFSTTKVDEFVELYYSSMLYDFPLIVRDDKLNLWDIFTQIDMNGFSSEGYLGLLATEFRIVNNHPQRTGFSDEHTFRFATHNPVFPNHDPMQVPLLSFAPDISNTLSISTLALKNVGSLSYHPDLAIQWEISDWEYNGELMVNGAHKFVIRDDAYWKKSILSENSPPLNNRHPVSAVDFGFAMQLHQLANSSTANGGWFSKDLVPKFEVNETENSITLYYSKPYLQVQEAVTRLLSPVPNFLLNQTLTYNASLSATPRELDHLGLSPFDTVEWNDHEVNPTGIGMFSFTQYAPGEYIKAELRDDYYYPNEWDSPNQDFLIHKPGPEDAYYFIYNSTDDETLQKPTTTFIDKMYFQGINQTGFVDYNTAWVDHFEKGIIDSLQLSFNNGAKIFEYIDDPRYQSLSFINDRGPEMLIFNLDNPHLQNYNLRKAISLAIDKTALSKVGDGLWLVQGSPLWRNQFGYNDRFDLGYSYDLARDLMRAEGYEALDTPDLFKEDFDIPTETISVPRDDLSEHFWTIPVGLGFVYLIKREKSQSKLHNEIMKIR